MKHPPLSISLTVQDGDAALKFYEAAFGAKEAFRMSDPSGGVAHAEFSLNGQQVFLSEASEEWHAFPMPEGSKSSCLFTLTVDDCDVTYRQAIDAGAGGLSAPQDQFWGSRSAVVLDPFGYRWGLVQVIEELSHEEVAERAARLFS
jgi:uncharacterized glyoxalase superfamily protein PhnB